MYSAASTNQFKVLLPITTDDTGVSTLTPAKLEDGQCFKEVYVGPEFFIDRSQTIDNHNCITLRKSEPITIHLSDYDHHEIAQLCEKIHLNPSYCELFYCRVGDSPYIPVAKGLKLWKIQRHVYRYINDVKYANVSGLVNSPEDTSNIESNSNIICELLSKGSLYERDELSPGNDDELDHYMKDLDISFAVLDARGRIQEIASQVRHHSISFELRLRDCTGQVFHILD